MLELFPDLELGIKIANSSLISPNIMEEEPTRIRLKKDNGAPSLVNSAIANIITGFISNKLNYSQISSIAKFHKGAWVHATIPEVLLDNIIVETIEGTEDDLIDTFFVRMRKEANTVWNNQSNKFEQGEYTEITEKIYLRNGKTQVDVCFHKPKLLKLTRGIKKEVCHSRCKNLSKELTYSSP